MNNKVISLKREIKDDYNYRESLKTLRTNIQFCGSNIRTIMFTSALPDEGKSDIAFSVAASFAQIGKKVIFIDADIRKSVPVLIPFLSFLTHSLCMYNTVPLFVLIHSASPLITFWQMQQTGTDTFFGSFIGSPPQSFV